LNAASIEQVASVLDGGGRGDNSGCLLRRLLSVDGARRLGAGGGA
jgi:hypothetical protein